jgi:hypothetical protein
MKISPASRCPPSGSLTGTPSSPTSVSCRIDPVRKAPGDGAALADGAMPGDGAMAGNRRPTSRTGRPWAPVGASAPDSGGRWTNGAMGLTAPFAAPEPFTAPEPEDGGATRRE